MARTIDCPHDGCGGTIRLELVDGELVAEHTPGAPAAPVTAGVDIDDWIGGSDDEKETD